MRSEKLKTKSEKLSEWFPVGKTMNRYAVLCFLFFILHSSFFTCSVFSQAVGINASGAAGNASAMLDVSSTTSGFLLPRMTTTQITAISNPASSLMVFNTTTNCLMIYSSNLSAWQNIYCACGDSSASFTQDSNSAFNSNTNTNVSVSNNTVTLASNENYGTGTSQITYTATTTFSLTAVTYDYGSFTIDSGATVTVDTIAGNFPLIIYCTGAVTINGTLNLNGSDGESSRVMSLGLGCGTLGNGNAYGYYTSATALYGANPSRGAYGPGGFWGASGNETSSPAQSGSGPGGGPGGTQRYYSGGGGGYGSAGGAGTGASVGGAINGTAQLASFVGGSGGGAGEGNLNFTTPHDDGGAGGGGGGAVKIIAPSITIGPYGSITANGGVGGGGEGGGGGGSGGAIWLISPTITNNGIVEALGGAGGCASPKGLYGGNGGYGRIRLDYLTSTGTGYVPPVGYTGTIPYQSTGTTYSPVITPSNLCSWGTLNYNVNTPFGASFRVIVTNINTSYSTVVSNGTNLSSIPGIATATSIQLEGVFNTTNNPSVTPTLYSWSVNYFKY